MVQLLSTQLLACLQREKIEKHSFFYEGKRCSKCYLHIQISYLMDYTFDKSWRMDKSNLLWLQYQQCKREGQFSEQNLEYW